jgi:hypothetical protein
LVRQPDLQNTVWYLGNLFTFLLTGQDSRNQLTIMRVTTARGNEPPPHRHSHEGEIYPKCRSSSFEQFTKALRGENRFPPSFH